jgi:hypothetical protein
MGTAPPELCSEQCQQPFVPILEQEEIGKCSWIPQHFEFSDANVNFEQELKKEW